VRGADGGPGGGGVRLLIAGDIEVNRGEPEKVFEGVLPELREADLRFGGLEASLSERGAPVQGKIVMRHPPAMIQGYLAGGFDVLAFASNHCLDYGIEPFLDTLELLEKHGIRHPGAGRDIAAARAPAILERKGTRIAFLSYLLELPLGWGANPAKPGVAPLRQDALFGPPYVNEEDLEAMAADVGRAKGQADAVVASFHWGVSQSRTLTLSQRAVARAAVDAGAGLVIGRHPHILQGVEVYKGAAIFYALGNFVLDHAHPMFMPTVKESILVRCAIDGKKIARLSFVPVLIGEDGRPRILADGEARCREILRVMEGLSAKLGTRLRVSGNEAAVCFD